MSSHKTQTLKIRKAKAQQDLKPEANTKDIRKGLQQLPFKENVSPFLKEGKLVKENVKEVEVLAAFLFDFDNKRRYSSTSGRRDLKIN